MQSDSARRPGREGSRGGSGCRSLAAVLRRTKLQPDSADPERSPRKVAALWGGQAGRGQYRMPGFSSCLMRRVAFRRPGVFLGL